jgi:predicted permease
MPGRRPPTVARWILERALPSDVRDDVSGDLEELFRRRDETDGAMRSRLWYWRHVAFFSLHFLAERLRERRRHTDMSTGFSKMDFKLGVRMLIRYPGLTVIGVVGMAVGIMICAGAFAILYTFVDPALPLDEGERIVALQTWDRARNQAERRVLHDVITWRDELRTVTDVGAFRQISRNLIAPGGPPETVRIAEMSAAGFRVARVAPLLGRHLLDEDERPGAPAVLVIGHEVWRNRFAADPAIVGRTVQLGDTRHVVVGVMPEGFRFPVNHRLWVPLRLDPSRHARLSGPMLTVFGRLSASTSLEGARAEIATIGRRTAGAFPSTHETLRPDVLPYTFPFFDMNDPRAAEVVHLMQALITVLLVIVCVNVAILVYARTATRHGEIAVRSALGASRRRIVAQLFVEALVLSAVAALAGVALTAFGLRQVNAAMDQILADAPFWWHFDVSADVVLYVLGLALLAAAIVGILPALQATGRRVQLGLQRISAGGGSGMQLGRTWRLLIVLQVAIAVALLPAAVYHAWDSVRHGIADPGLDAEQFLTAQLVLDRAAASGASANPNSEAFAARYAVRQAELVRRLQAEPGLTDITVASSVPGTEATAWIEADGVAVPAGAAEQTGWVATGTRAGHEVRFNRVDPEFFDVFGVPLLTGRPLAAADALPGASAILVNQSFVRNVLGNGEALGRRIRYVGVSNDAAVGEVALGPWHEIVGVVGDFPAKPTASGLADAKMYHLALPGQLVGATIAMRIRAGEPAGFAGRLREIGAAVDPNLQLRNVASLDVLLRQEQRMMRLVATVLGVLTTAVLLLSAAGIYSLMSFSVSQRRKEIGIRAALGADPGRILRGIFSRAIRQLAAGALLGVLVAGLLELATDGGLMNGHGPVVLPIVTVVVIAVGLLAVLGPARRGLRVQPTEALREQ